ncbi:MAG: hypothetical protein Q3993_02985 [Filifactor alocis]|nr:hypothetical protein [Filifactor alocis]
METKYRRTIRLVFILLILLIGGLLYLMLTHEPPSLQEETIAEDQEWVENPETIVIPLKETGISQISKPEAEKKGEKTADAKSVEVKAGESAKPLTDYEDSPVKEAIIYGIEQGYLFETETGKFLPEKNIQRFEFIRMINKAFGFQEEAEIRFVDVKKEDFFYRDVCIAMSQKYLYTFNGNRFGPYKYFYRWELPYILGRLTKQEVSVEDFQTLELYSDSLQIPKNARGYVELFLKKGWMKPESASRFGSKSILTKEEVAYTLYKLKLSGALK